MAFYRDLSLWCVGPIPIHPLALPLYFAHSPEGFPNPKQTQRARCSERANFFSGLHTKERGTRYFLDKIIVLQDQSSINKDFKIMENIALS